MASKALAGVEIHWQPATHKYLSLNSIKYVRRGLRSVSVSIKCSLILTRKISSITLFCLFVAYSM